MLMQVDKSTYEASRFHSPSPWVKFSASPSPRSDGLEIEMRRSDGIPKLAPEIEQGNVEYKLILKNPSPERLHRLVTQLNWRLMEGNGQAYYQLGVADSGELVGLTKEEMEATLETLENMAGELGASVVISREIEVRGRLSGLALESVNGMGDKDMDGSMSSLSTSAEVSATDTDTSDADATDGTDDTAADSPIAPSAAQGDPDEIIVRSAPVPITHSFLRRTTLKATVPSKRWQRQKTLKPDDFSAPRMPENGIAPFSTADEDADDEDPQFGFFNFSDMQTQLPPHSTNQLDPARPPKSKVSKPTKASKGLKVPRQPNEAKAPPTAAEAKTPEQIAQKLADKRTKRDKRREERARALMDPIYDHTELVAQDGGEVKIDYEKLVAEDIDDSSAAVGSPSDNGLMSSLVTLKQENITRPSHQHGTMSPNPFNQNVSPIDLTEDHGSIIPPSAIGDARGEPRLIVEALVVRKAGFGRGFVDLSQFDEELRHLPSFSLS